MAKFIKQSVVLATLICLLILREAMAKPRPSSHAMSSSLGFNLSGCQIDSNLQETCQRCAKVTKSNVVYPMCCSNEDEAYQWCQKYLGYGIH